MYLSLSFFALPVTGREGHKAFPAIPAGLKQLWRKGVVQRPIESPIKTQFVKLGGSDLSSIQQLIERI